MIEGNQESDEIINKQPKGPPSSRIPGKTVASKLHWGNAVAARNWKESSRELPAN